MFKRIDHIELLTAAPERIVGFYTERLGFRERERLRIPQTPSGPLELIYLELGGTTIEVMCYPEAKAIPARSGELRLGWQCLALRLRSETRKQVASAIGDRHVPALVCGIVYGVFFTQRRIAIVTCPAGQTAAGLVEIHQQRNLCF